MASFAGVRPNTRDTKGILAFYPRAAFEMRSAPSQHFSNCFAANFPQSSFGHINALVVALPYFARIAT